MPILPIEAGAEGHIMSDETKEPAVPANGVWQGVSSVARYVSTKSVMTSLQWYTIPAMGLGVVLMLWAKEPFSYIGAAAFLIALLMFAGVYLYWTKFAPDRLQSEEWRTENCRLDVELLGDDKHKLESGQVIDVTPVANTHLLQAESMVIRTELGSIDVAIEETK